MYSKVVGSNVLIFGDLHFSDVHTGKHKNYLASCMTVLAQMEKIIEERKPSAVVLLGDIVGVREINIRSRVVLGQLCKTLQNIASKCKLYAVRGNHDSGDYPDYQFLSDLGFFETSEMCKTDDTKLGYFDYFAREDDQYPEIRFHLMDFGCEDKELVLSESDQTSDVVLAHNNFVIQGCTTWYNSKDGIELCGMDNLKGVHMVVSGHIHNPSPQNFITDMRCGGACELFYPGCPTRPSVDQDYESCWVVRFECKNGTTDWFADDWELASLEDTFITKETFIEEKTDEEIADEEERKKALKDVLQDIMSCRLGSNDLESQIRSIPNATEASKEIAVTYLNNALNRK